jgi:hypothetical protein
MATKKTTKTALAEVTVGLRKYVSEIDYHILRSLYMENPVARYPFQKVDDKTVEITVAGSHKVTLPVGATTLINGLNNLRDCYVASAGFSRLCEAACDTWKNGLIRYLLETSQDVFSPTIFLSKTLLEKALAAASNSQKQVLSSVLLSACDEPTGVDLSEIVVLDFDPNECWTEEHTHEAVVPKNLPLKVFDGGYSGHLLGFALSNGFPDLEIKVTGEVDDSDFYIDEETLHKILPGEYHGMFDETVYIPLSVLPDLKEVGSLQIELGHLLNWYHLLNSETAKITFQKTLQEFKLDGLYPRTNQAELKDLMQFVIDNCDEERLKEVLTNAIEELGV